MTNEAAERLWEAIDKYWPSAPPRELFDEAFAFERKATVERIQVALGVPLWHLDVSHAYFDMETTLAILDAELSASPETDSQAER